MAATTLGRKWQRFDPEALAADREVRYRERVEKVNADNALHPALRDKLLDRDLWGTQRIYAETGISPQRITAMRGKARKKPRHPGSFPPPDGIQLLHNRLQDPVVEAGAVLLWALHTGRLVWNSKTLTLETAPPHRHGRRRTRKPQQ